MFVLATLRLRRAVMEDIVAGEAATPISTNSAARPDREVAACSAVARARRAP